MADHQEWLSPKAMAEELGIPVRTIYNWRVRDEGPPGFRFGRHVRYRRVDVDRWIEEQADAKKSKAS